MKRRLLKTILYRLSATVIVQVTSWIICREIKVNIIVALTDFVSTSWYYFFDWIWEKKAKPLSKS